MTDNISLFRYTHNEPLSEAQKEMMATSFYLQKQLHKAFLAVIAEMHMHNEANQEQAATTGASTKNTFSPHWMSVAKTHFQQGFMAMRAGIANESYNQ